MMIKKKNEIKVKNIKLKSKPYVHNSVPVVEIKTFYSLKSVVNKFWFYQKLLWKNMSVKMNRNCTPYVKTQETTNCAKSIMQN